MAGEMAFVYSTPAGVAGAVSRPLDSEVETVILGATPSLAYGVPVVIDGSGLVNKVANTNVQADLKGILVRSVPAITGTTASGFSDNVPNTTMPQARMTHGYVNVVCAVGTPVKGQPAYVRLTADTGKLVGDIEATADVTVAGGVITGTGTGTIAATVTSAAIVGTWSLVLQTTSNTSKVTVVDPLGVRHGDATVGTAYTTGGLTFTITAAETMTEGDSFSPVVTAKNVVFLGTEWAVNGKDANNIAELQVKGV